MPTTTQTITDTAHALHNAVNKNTLESRLLEKRLIRKLYETLGAPTREDFPDAYKHAGYFSKATGYTRIMTTTTPQDIRKHNTQDVFTHVKRMSETKQRIVADYKADEWFIIVYPQNVICTKIIRHPRFPEIAVKFYVSRDSATYEYMLCEDD